MGSFGECCCGPPDCCLANADYPNWDNGGQPGSCCRVCEFAIVDDPWTLVCSDPIRTDTRSASAEYKYYTTPHPVSYADDPNAPVCSTVKTLCATATETHEVVVIERLMLRYRKISQSSSVTKIQITCGADPNACRWIVSSKICLEVQYGQFEFRSEDHDATFAGSSCCVLSDTAWLKNIHTAMPTCAEKATSHLPGLGTSTTVCIKRLKVFDTKPTGVITFADGDWVTCEAIGICIRDGVQSFSIASIDGGNEPWTAPVCLQVNQGGNCIAIKRRVAQCCIPPAAAGTVVGELASTTCYIGMQPFYCTYQWNGTVWVPVYVCELDDTGDAINRMFARINPNFGFLSVPGQESLSGIGVNYICRFDCNGVSLPDKYMSEVTCTLLTTPFHPTPTYTARTIPIVLPTWSVDLGACP